MKRRVSKNAISLARTLGVAGLLAVALVMTPGCSQADDHQTAVQVANSDNAQEEGAVYGKMSIQSPASRCMIPRLAMAGRSPLFAGTPSTTEPQIPLPLEATLRPIRISRCFMAVLPPIYRKIPSLRKGLRREANATVCRFSNSMTCPPLKLRSTARALDRTLSTRPLNWNRPHA